MLMNASTLKISIGRTASLLLLALLAAAPTQLYGQAPEPVPPAAESAAAEPPQQESHVGGEAN